ncbi:MAG: ankyrin repeat domain-containing protein [Acidobacteriota bacterium]
MWSCNPTPAGRRFGVWAAALVVAAALLKADTADNGRLLIEAVKAGNRAAVAELLTERGRVNTAEADGTTPLHWAVRRDDLAMAQQLIRAGADPKAANRYGVQPVMLAAVNGSAAVLELLLAAGADANASLPDGGETVLMTAARTGQPAAVKVLLAHGAQVNAHEREYGETPLIWAAEEDRAEAVALLVDAGAEIDGRSAASKFSREKLGQSVLPKGSWTPLMYAARQGSIGAARTLADKGASLNVTAPDGATALVLAIINTHYDLAAMLLEKGADPNVADVTGMAALYAAVDMNTLPWAHGRAAPKFRDRLDGLGMIRTLLDYGAEVDARLIAPKPQRQHTSGDTNLGVGATPLMRATKAGDVPVMRLLLDYGAAADAKLKDGTNLLMIAAGMGWRGGFDTFRDPGTESGAIEAIKFCLALGFDINGTNDKKQTPLHGAIGRGPRVVEFLVTSGADLQARDNTNRTPLESLLGGGRRGRAAAPGAAAQQNDRLLPESTLQTIALLQRLAAERGLPATPAPAGTETKPAVPPAAPPPAPSGAR